MSFIPSPYLVRLQELKLWQGNYDNLLQKQRTNCEDLSDFDDLDGITPISEPIFSPKSKRENVDWDQQTILPTTKPFNELLEEKIALDQPSEVSVTVKKPFLKKGTGLARYKLDPNTIINKNKKKVKSNKVICKDDDKQVKSTPENIETQEIPITPLKVPDFSIKCKAKWTKVNAEEENCNEHINRFNPHYVIDKINRFAQSFRSPTKSKEENRDLQTSSSNDCYKNNCLDNSFSNSSEKELHIFETLEEKVDHSSFLSTNTSIVRLLAFTPCNNNVSPSKTKHSNEDLNVCQQLRSSDVLTKILNNLKLISEDNANGYCSNNQSNRSSPNSSFSEDKKISKNGESFCETPSSFYTEFESTLGRLQKVNTAVNTSFSYKNDSICQNCGELRQKLEILLQETSKIEVEKTKLFNYGKELEKQRDVLNVEVEKLKQNYEKDVEDLREELEEEKKKFAREKALVDMYIKDVRPKKKDFLEVENLKKELIDLKELLKLKETKNGTTQARLRNQIKQLDKEKNELKSSIEILQKENAKLNATQKVHRNAEARMLQEISRNLNRLTEETMKGDVNNSETSNVGTKEKCRIQKKVKRRSMGELKEKVEKELQIEEYKNGNILAMRHGTPPAVEVIYNNDLMDTNLEKQYESSFGLVNGQLVRNEGVIQVKKVLTEREFADGSKEIKYVNGTTKTISPNGKLIYLQYSNGDIRETNLTEHTQKYYYVKKNIWLTKYADGTEIIEFPNGQKEERFADGKVQVTALDGTILTTFPEGTQEINYPDGSRMVQEKEEKVIYLPNGQKETHTPEFKKREYPDGTVKIIYSDGTQESRYANGRVRIKDETGALILDSHINSVQ